MILTASHYNFFIPFKAGQYIAFNARTGAIAVVEEEKVEQFNRFVEKSQPLDENFKKDLIYGGFLLPEEIDEKELLHMTLLKGKYDPTRLGLTIAPTLKCNFKCPYCFEAGVEMPGKMQKDVQNQLIEFVKEKLEKETKGLYVVWYGGEPLLETDVIYNLGKKIIQLADQYKVEYVSSLITNGFLFTQDVVEQIKDLRIEKVQITLDGPPELHDTRRITHGNEPTFYTILDNIKMALQKPYCPEIALRVHVDQDSFEHCQRVVDILEQEELKDKVRFDFASVHPLNDNQFSPKCLSMEEYSLHTMNLKKKLSELGFNISYRFPSMKTHFCSADMPTGYVIDPLGYFYKCWVDIGFPERAFGKLGENDPGLTNYDYLKNELKYMSFDPLQHLKCSRCKYLPICSGGCPQLRKSRPGDFCQAIRYNLEETLKGILENNIIEKMREARAKV